MWVPKEKEVQVDSENLNGRGDKVGENKREAVYRG